MHTVRVNVWEKERKVEKENEGKRKSRRRRKRKRKKEANRPIIFRKCETIPISSTASKDFGSDFVASKQVNVRLPQGNIDSVRIIFLQLHFYSTYFRCCWNLNKAIYLIIKFNKIFFSLEYFITWALFLCLKFYSFLKFNVKTIQVGEPRVAFVFNSF